MARPKAKKADEVTTIKPQKQGNKFVSQVKLFFFTLLLGAGVLVAVYLYLWYDNVVKSQTQAKEVLARKNQLEVELKDYSLVKSKIFEQISRCQSLIGQGSGDFSQFEYCKKFIEWSNSLPESSVKQAR